METKNFLPENDKDLHLAKLLGSTLGAGEKISSIQDPLIKSLLGYKAKEQQEIESLQDSVMDIWNNIYKETQLQKNARITPLFERKNSIRIWATAATVLIATFIGIFWFINLDQPKLIAQSETNIEFITLEDGSQISLRPNSSLFEVALSNTERSYMLKGEGFFEVSKDLDRPFSVQANNGKITVLGTQFNISTWGNETLVFLEEGSVRLDDDNDNTLLLNPGEKAIINNENISKSIATNSDEYKDWLNNQITLNSTPLTKVVSELEHHFKITINIDQIDNKSELISGTIPLSDLTNTLNDLGIILGGTFREDNRDSFVFIPLN